MQALDRKLELDTALEAVRRAAIAAMTVRADLGARGAGTITKQDNSPVTVADFAAQAVVAATLEAAFPNDSLVGEEDAVGLRGDAASALRARVTEIVSSSLARRVGHEEVLAWLDRGQARGDTERYWVVDPIDGTKGFLRGGQFAIALALIEGGEVTAAVLACPAYDLAPQAIPGLLFGAMRGSGAFEVSFAGSPPSPRRPVRVAVWRGQSLLRVCESVESGHTDQAMASAIVQRLGLVEPPLRLDSQAKYAAVARGDADVYLRLPTRADYREKVWDHAAGALLLAEAGGTVTDVDGRPLDFARGTTLQGNRGVVATTGTCHDRVVAVVQQVLSK